MQTRHTFKVPGDWAQQWPCSCLAGHEATTVQATNGDLLNLETEADTDDLEAAELEAAMETYGGRTLGSALDLR